MIKFNFKLNSFISNLLKNKKMSKAPQFAHWEAVDSKKLPKTSQAEVDYAVIKYADMSERMQQHAVDCCNHAF